MRESFVRSDRSLDALDDVHPATGRAVLFSYLAMADATSIARKAVEAEFRLRRIKVIEANEDPRGSEIFRKYSKKGLKRLFTNHSKKRRSMRRRTCWHSFNNTSKS